MQISIYSSGNSDITLKWLEGLKRSNPPSMGDRWGQMGVQALSAATPVDTGRTAAGWAYRVVPDAKGFSVEWYNTNAPYGTVVALLIQYGHGTRGGGYVAGFDFINPAMRPIFQQVSADVSREVNNA